MSSNIPNFFIFEVLSCEPTDFPLYCESFLNSKFALLFLLTLSQVSSPFPYHFIVLISSSSHRASTIFHDHHEGVTRTKKHLEGGANVDHAGTGTYENLISARRCGNKRESFRKILPHSITIINIPEVELGLKIKTLEVTSEIRTNSEADTVLCLLSSYICLMWPR